MRGVRGRRRLLLAVLLALLVGGTTWAQDGTSNPTPTPAPASPTPARQKTSAATARTVAVDASGGPASLPDDLRAAIAAWTSAAPDLAKLSIDPKAASTVGYAAPARLGPDTLSLDLRVPGRDGVEVHVASGAPAAHPMVLLHEVGVLLGLPEGGSGVMAYAVPASNEPTAPTAADVQVLRAQRTYAREDLNRDGKVDFYDLVRFSQAFGTQGVNLPADFNGDGRVDRQDLAMLESAYTFAPPSKTEPGQAPSAAPSSSTPSSTTSPAPSDGSGSTSPPAPNGSSGATGGGGDVSPPPSGTP